MNKKITRRAILAGAIGILISGPFVIRAFRKNKKLELGEDSFLAAFRTKYQEALSFPRQFELDGRNLTSYERKGFSHIKARFQSLLSEDEQNKILTIHKRYWSNFSQIDEMEFDYSAHLFNANGHDTIMHGYMDAHVKMKYGYGMEIKGYDVAKKPFHWVFNLDAEASLPIAQEMNLSSMMLGFFDIYTAIPEMGFGYVGIFAENVHLPTNPYIESAENKFIALSKYVSTQMPQRVRDITFHRTYFNLETGMPELDIRQTIEDSYNSKYNDPEIELPLPVFCNTVYKHEKYGDIFLPVEIDEYRMDNSKYIRKYSNIKVKFI
jgi:hypothetical protein